MTEDMEAVTTIEVQRLHCLRCGHTWIPKKLGHLPKNCANPKCNSPYWDKPRKVKKNDQ